MLRTISLARLHWPALVGVLALALAAAAVVVLQPTGPGRASAHGGSPPTPGAATRTVRVSPVTDTGVLKPTWRVTLQRRHGTCVPGSEAVGDDAYRCFAGNLVLDPCWALADVATTRALGHRVACAASPWRRNVALVGVRRLPHLTGHRDNIWGIELVGGRRCTFLQGASSVHHGQRISYGCGGRLYLYGEPDRSTPRWHIGAVVFRHGHFRDDHTVAIAEVVLGGRSPAV